MTAAPEGRRMLRLEIRNAETPIERKPEWIKTKAKMGPGVPPAAGAREERRASTPSARRPAAPTSTSAGRTARRPSSSAARQCTRRCDFCQIDTGKPADYDTDEPRRVAESVTADEPAVRDRHGRRARRPARRGRVAARRDGPARSTARTPAPASRSSRPTSRATPTCSARSSDARPEVFAHNVETVPRIFKRIRPAFRYERSLDVLTQARDAGPDHEVEPDPRHGRGARRGQPGAARPARRRHRHHHDHPVPASDAHGTCRSRAGCARRSSSRSRTRPRRSDSSVCSPDRSCARRYRAGRLWAQSMVAKGRDSPGGTCSIWPTPSLGFAQAVS